jgi:hypothetical protein
MIVEGRIELHAWPQGLLLPVSLHMRWLGLGWMLNV